jgi:hypothetical protein
LFEDNYYQEIFGCLSSIMNVKTVSSDLSTNNPHAKNSIYNIGIIKMKREVITETHGVCQADAGIYNFEIVGSSVTAVSVLIYDSLFMKNHFTIFNTNGVELNLKNCTFSSLEIDKTKYKPEIESS